MRKFLILFLSSVCWGATVKLGLITDIHYADDNDPGWPLISGRYLDQAEDKCDAAIANLSDCDIIINHGDLMEMQNNSEAEILDNFNAADGITRYHTIGNHDVAKTLQSKTQYLSDISQASEYFSYDIPDTNVHVVILNATYYKWVATNGDVDYYEVGDASRPTHGDGGYYVDRNGTADETQSFWISPAQLTWLETDLTTADAAGKYSTIHTHQDISRNTVDRFCICNSDVVRAILESHRVIACVNGHRHQHSPFKGNCYPKNILGRSIWYFTLEGCIDGDYDGGAGTYAHYKLLIDDSTGNWSLLDYAR